MTSRPHAAFILAVLFAFHLMTRSIHAQNFTEIKPSPRQTGERAQTTVNGCRYQLEVSSRGFRGRLQGAATALTAFGGVLLVRPEFLAHFMPADGLPFAIT